VQNCFVNVYLCPCCSKGVCFTWIWSGALFVLSLFFRSNLFWFMTCVICGDNVVSCSASCCKFYKWIRLLFHHQSNASISMFQKKCIYFLLKSTFQLRNGNVCCPWPLTTYSWLEYTFFYFPIYEYEEFLLGRLCSGLPNSVRSIVSSCSIKLFFWGLVVSWMIWKERNGRISSVLLLHQDRIFQRPASSKRHALTRK